MPPRVETMLAFVATFHASSRLKPIFCPYHASTAMIGPRTKTDAGQTSTSIGSPGSAHAVAGRRTSTAPSSAAERLLTGWSMQHEFSYFLDALPRDAVSLLDRERMLRRFQ